jgi:hypothetical protein
LSVFSLAHGDTLKLRLGVAPKTNIGFLPDTSRAAAQWHRMPRQGMVI